MYSIREICFTAAVALAVWFGLNSLQDITKPRLQNPGLNLVDGTHPPLPTLLPPHASLGDRRTTSGRRNTSATANTTTAA